MDAGWCCDLDWNPLGHQLAADLVHWWRSSEVALGRAGCPFVLLTRTQGFFIPLAFDSTSLRRCSGQARLSTGLRADSSIQNDYKKVHVSLKNLR
jgi:hypothetical protein